MEPYVLFPNNPHEIVECEGCGQKFVQYTQDNVDVLRHHTKHCDDYAERAAQQEEKEQREAWEPFFTLQELGVLHEALRFYSATALGAQYQLEGSMIRYMAMRNSAADAAMTITGMFASAPEHDHMLTDLLTRIDGLGERMNGKASKGLFEPTM